MGADGAPAGAGVVEGFASCASIAGDADPTHSTAIKKNSFTFFIALCPHNATTCLFVQFGKNCGKTDDKSPAKATIDGND